MTGGPPVGPDPARPPGAPCPPGGRFGEPAMQAALSRLVGRLGLDPGPVRLVRLANNAVFELPAHGLVVRIARSHRLHERVRRGVHLARWLAGHDAPAIRLADGFDQPLVVDDLLATLWQRVPPTGPPPGPGDLGRVLRRFHALPPGPVPRAAGTAPGAAGAVLQLPRWNPVADARARLDDAEALAATTRADLEAWCDDLAPRVEALAVGARPTLVHGDAHVGNLLRRQDGGVVLCDFDAVCLGPWGVDLAAVAVGERRFGRPGAHRHLAEAYGADVTDDPAWPVLREARELKMVAAAVPLLASGAGVAREFEHRLTTVLAGDTAARWTPFAAVH